MYIILIHLALAYIWVTFMSEILFDIKLKMPRKLQWLFSKTYCFKCVAFWLTLILTHNIYTAAIVSTIAIIIEKYNNE